MIPVKSGPKLAGGDNRGGDRLLAYRGPAGDRYGTSSTIITSQLDPKNWHSIVGEETIADSVCDRLVHTHKVRLSGESLRKARGTLTPKEKPAK